MTTDEAPFYITRVECPVCKTINDFETIKMGAYEESGRDSDFCPSRREWHNPKYQQVNPLLYYTASCSSCFYTREFNRKFREWKDDDAFRTHHQKVVRQRHLNALAASGSLLKSLGEALWPGSYPGPTAINKLLLAILDELMLDQPSHLDIGRWYLRIGWLFREQGPGQTTNPSPRAVKQMRLGSALRELVQDVGRISARIGEIKQMVDSGPEAAAASPDDTDGPDRCRRTVNSMIESIEAITQGTDSLLEHLTIGGDTNRDRSDAGAETFGQHASYVAFLEEAHAKWTGVPTCEWDAMVLALEHYKKAFEEARDVPPGNIQIQLTYMIGELARRVGQYQESRQYLNLAIRSGREWIQGLNNDQTKSAFAQHVVDLAVEQMDKIREALAAAG